MEEEESGAGEVFGGGEAVGVTCREGPTRTRGARKMEWALLGMICGMAYRERGVGHVRSCLRTRMHDTDTYGT